MHTRKFTCASAQHAMWAVDCTGHAGVQASVQASVHASVCTHVLMHTCVSGGQMHADDIIPQVSSIMIFKIPLFLA